MIDTAKTRTYLKSIGMTKKEVDYVFKKNGDLDDYSHEVLKKNVELLKSYELKYGNIVQIFIQNPSLATLPLVQYPNVVKKLVNPNFEINQVHTLLESSSPNTNIPFKDKSIIKKLKNLGLSEIDIALLAEKEIFLKYTENRVVMVVQVLSQCGYNSSQIVNALSIKPKLCNNIGPSLPGAFQKLQSMGITKNVLLKELIDHPPLGSATTQNIDDLINEMTGKSFTEDQVNCTFRARPEIATTSVNKFNDIYKVISLSFIKTGLTSNDMNSFIASFPTVLSNSSERLEKLFELYSKYNLLKYIIENPGRLIMSYKLASARINFFLSKGHNLETDIFIDERLFIRYYNINNESLIKQYEQKNTATKKERSKGEKQTNIKLSEKKINEITPQSQVKDTPAPKKQIKEMPVDNLLSLMDVLNRIDAGRLPLKGESEKVRTYYYEYESNFWHIYESGSKEVVICSSTEDFISSEKTLKFIIKPQGEITMYKNFGSLPHCEDGPAIFNFKGNKLVSKKYCIFGKVLENEEEFNLYKSIFRNEEELYSTLALGKQLGLNQVSGKGTILIETYAALKRLADVYKVNLIQQRPL